MPDPLDAMPDVIRKGDSYEIKVSDGNFPSPTWTLTLYMVGATNNANVIATQEPPSTGSDHLITLTTSITDALTAESTSWEWKVTDGSTVTTIDQGRLEVEANFASVGASDQRSHARKVLDAICALIEGRASKDQEEYTIKDRSLKRMPMEDLLGLKDKYTNLVAIEERNEKGQGNRLAKVRFNRP